MAAADETAARAEGDAAVAFRFAVAQHGDTAARRAEAEVFVKQDLGHGGVVERLDEIDVFRTDSGTVITASRRARGRIRPLGHADRRSAFDLRRQHAHGVPRIPPRDICAGHDRRRRTVRSGTAHEPRQGCADHRRAQHLLQGNRRLILREGIGRGIASALHHDRRQIFGAQLETGGIAAGVKRREARNRQPEQRLEIALHQLGQGQQAARHFFRAADQHSVILPRHHRQAGEVKGRGAAGAGILEIGRGNAGDAQRARHGLREGHSLRDMATIKGVDRAKCDARIGDGRKRRLRRQIRRRGFGIASETHHAGADDGGFRHPGPMRWLATRSDSP